MKRAAAGTPLRVLFATSECAPWVKTGGLGDVSTSLPRALAARGHDVRVLMPAYGALRRELGGNAISLPASGVWPAARLARAANSGFELWLLDCPSFYDRAGGPYLDTAGRDHADNAQRFGFLSHMAARLCTPDGPWPGWAPDVLHANDWPTGLAPAYLSRLMPRSRAQARPARLFTIHNLAFQGLFPAHVAQQLALPAEWLRVEGEGLLHWDQVCMLKAGVRHADAITTVSPTYAREIQSAPLGFGMEGMLSLRRERLHGILNGIDTAVWNPQTDPLIARRYGADTLDAKAANKAALQTRMGLQPEPGALLLGVVSRLTEQKGIDLVLDNARRLAEAGFQLAVLGAGDTQLEQRLRTAMAAYPGRIAAEIGFDEGLAHLIEAGADCFVMPSRFEPCGLNQLYSLAYGTPPLVHATGGLADSVIDVQRNPQGNGFAIGEPTAEALWQALQAVERRFRDPDAWRALQRRGMDGRFGWADSAQRYESLYRHCMAMP